MRVSASEMERERDKSAHGEYNNDYTEVLQLLGLT